MNSELRRGQLQAHISNPNLINDEPVEQQEELERESCEGNHLVATASRRHRRSSSSSSNHVILCNTLAIVEERRDQRSTEHQSSCSELSGLVSAAGSNNDASNSHDAASPTDAMGRGNTNDSENCQASARRDDCELEIDLPTEELGIIVASDGPLGAVAIASHPLMDLDAIQPDILHLSTDDQPVINNTVTTTNDGLNQHQLIDERPLLMRRK